MKSLIVLLIVAIVAITTLEAIALVNGINGKYLALSFAGIGTAAGYGYKALRQKLADRKEVKNAPGN